VETTLSSGLVVGHRKNKLKTGNISSSPSGLTQVELVLPSKTANLLKHPALPSSIALPKGLSNSKTVMSPQAEDVLQYSTIGDADFVAERTSTELAQAIVAPDKFLIGEIEKGLKGSGIELSDVQSIIDLLRNEFTSNLYAPRDPKMGDRRKMEIKTYDKFSDTTNVTYKTLPGPMEAVCIAVADLLKEHSFRDVAERVVTSSIGYIIKDFRINTVDRLELPEMPDLTRRLIEYIDQFPARTSTRVALYNLLEQIALTSSQQEELIKKMDAQKDLDHPLAFQLTLSIADNNPQAEWVKTQEERRGKLLEQLRGSNEEMFVKYADLFEQSRGLVFHGNPAFMDDPAGKVGMEFEFLTGNRELEELAVRNEKRILSSNKEPIERSNNLDTVWELGHDRGDYSAYLETRRSSDHLYHDGFYTLSLVSLYKWFKDNATSIASRHIHLDKDDYPNPPNLGGLFQESQETTFFRTDHPTWEVRGLLLPKGHNYFNPARHEDAAALFMYGASSKTISEVKNKIKVQDEDSVSLNRVIWGHLASYIQNPNGRLAGLMALHDDFTFRGCNPFAFIHTYDLSSLPTVINQIRDKFGEEGGILLDLLKNTIDNNFDTIEWDASPWWPKYMAIRAAGYFPPDARELFVKAIKDEYDPEVARIAVGILGEQPKMYKDLLEMALNHKDELVSNDAKRALNKANEVI